MLAPVYARAEPSPTARKVMFVSPIAPYTHGPTILLVMDHRVVDGLAWTKLLLPKRPNGSTGWVRSDYLRFWKQTTRVVIDQSERMTYVFRSGKLLYRTRNAVGTAATPTPNGYFAVAEKAYLPSWGFLGPVVLVTTGYSEVLNEYAGGNGRFALHGTSQPWLIGTRASHGCIRHRNKSILALNKMVPIGTPVRIHA
ncbi:MAG TPA: L,D-transpeptidase [Miltoncostaeales bacterium]|nr:L,D-transpeptidase [Miltoncostaeales bacterium]